MQLTQRQVNLVQGRVETGRTLVVSLGVRGDSVQAREFAPPKIEALVPVVLFDVAGDALDLLVKCAVGKETPRRHGEDSDPNAKKQPSPELLPIGSLRHRWRAV